MTREACKCGTRMIHPKAETMVEGDVVQIVQVDAEMPVGVRNLLSEVWNAHCKPRKHGKAEEPSLKAVDDLQREVRIVQEVHNLE